jgi:hypothetical protein
MLQRKEQLFKDFVQFVTQQGCGVVYIRDPRQDVPSDCGFVRVRLPGEQLSTSVGIVRFLTREEGMMACKMFAECSAEPVEWQMNFPRMPPQTFASPTFAEAQAVAGSRWRQWKRALRTWVPAWLVLAQKRSRRQHDMPDAG